MSQLWYRTMATLAAFMAVWQWSEHNYAWAAGDAAFLVWWVMAALQDKS